MVRENINNLILIFTLSLLSIFLSLSFIFAAASAPTAVHAENNVTAVYDEGNFSINWTSGGGDEVNYSIYIYTDGVIFTKADNNSETGYSFSNTTEANYTFTIEAVNATLNAVNSSNVSIYVDRTSPVILLSSYSNATFKSNSSTLTLNISISDASSGLTGSQCLVEINGTNESVAVSSGWCNSTQFNLTGLSDGNQTINVYVNDTVNIFGLNNSFVVFIDSTAPNASASCTPSNPTDNGETVRCTCSGVDSGVGINSSLTTASSSTKTSTTGTFSYACSVTDNAGNSASDSASYTVTGGGVSSSSSSGSSSSSSTDVQWNSYYSATENDIEEGYTKMLGAKTRVKFKLNSENHHVGVVSLTDSKATIEIASDPVKVVLAIGEDAKVDLDKDGFYDLHVILNSISDGEADLTIQKIHEEVSPESSGSVSTSGEIANSGELPAGSKKNLSGIFILVVILAAAVLYSISRRKQ